MNLKFNFTKHAVFNIIFLFFVLNSAAQKDNLITGVIIDTSTGKPVPHVEVFISGQWQQVQISLISFPGL